MKWCRACAIGVNAKIIGRITDISEGVRTAQGEEITAPQADGAV